MNMMYKQWVGLNIKIRYFSHYVLKANSSNEHIFTLKKDDIQHFL